MRNRVVLPGVILTIAVAACPLYGSGSAAYSVVPIPLPAGASGFPDPFGINDAGVVALSSGPGGGTTEIHRSFLWQNGTSTIIPAPPVTHTLVYQVTDTGTAVGLMVDPSQTLYGFVWDSATGDLSFPAAADGTRFNRIAAINGQGVAAGDIGGPGDGGVAATWDPVHGMTPLPSLGSGHAYAHAINDAGQVVGSSGDPFLEAYPLNTDAPLGIEHAVLWQNGEVVDLTPGMPYSYAYDINNHGQVVGSFDPRLVLPGGPALMLDLPYVWDATNGLITLTPLGHTSEAVAINDAGLIVGHSDTGDAEARALLWRDWQVYDLNSLIPADAGWVLQYAVDINDAGQIVGTGLYNGQTAAFLLTPDGASAAIPEPTACALAGMAVGGFALRRRRRV